MTTLLNLNKKELLDVLLNEGGEFIKFIHASESINQLREKFFEYLNQLERSYFNLFDESDLKNIHIIEKNNAKECIRVFKNIIRTENETVTGYSALSALYKLIKTKENFDTVSEGFIMEFIALFKGIKANTEFNKELFVMHEDEETAGIQRSEKLDEYSNYMQTYMKRYKSGLDSELSHRQKLLKEKIIKYFNATEDDWNNYTWHIKNGIKNAKTLSDLVELSDEELEGIQLAEANHIPFQITPYYLTLFNEKGRNNDDKFVRSMVMPSAVYCKNVKENRELNLNMDFMGEKSTTPVKCITRRYPQILILKPYDSCPQICVYCQRNWEIKKIGETRIAKKEIDNAIDWVKHNKHISEVLVTGGDPLTMNNQFINNILQQISEIDHIERIRIGTRTLVTLPYRFNDKLIDILERYNEFGRREISIITHFGHSTEITPDVLTAVKKLKKAGLNIYNQQVYTYYNSFKYETAKLRRTLKVSGIDPYYSFNTKGKEETIDYRVPMARIQQERKEEARFLPGIVRTDEPVFNVPKLGKSHLRAWQDHEPVMISENGQRIYRFYPWESRVTLVDDYLYTDVSIWDYLKRLNADGQNVDDYKTIWYYF